MPVMQAASWHMRGARQHNSRQASDFGAVSQAMVVESDCCDEKVAGAMPTSTSSESAETVLVARRHRT
jgi:hypothetical protein